MSDTKIVMNSSRYNRSILLLGFILAFVCFFSEYQLYRSKVSDKLLGFNKAWQSNANSQFTIKANYKPYVLDAYNDIENYLGLKQENNIKKWFGAFLERLNNLDTKKNLSDDIWRVNNYNALWRTAKDIDIVNKVNYDKGLLVSGQYTSQPDSFSNRIFKEFIDYTRSSFENLRFKKGDGDANTDFDLYNHVALSNFFADKIKDYDITASYIKVHRFFIASVQSNAIEQTIQVANNKLKDSLQSPNDLDTVRQLYYFKSGKSNRYSMAVYPAYFDQSYSEIKIPDRPWYQAAMTHKFPLHYRTKDENYDAEFGLTGLYNDVATATTTELDRTFTCTFKLPNLNKNVQFIACMDLFCDNSVDLSPPNPFTVSRRVNLGYTSLISKFPFLGVPDLPLGWCSVVDSILLFFILYLLMQINWIKENVISILEGIINQFNSYKYATFFLQRLKVYSLKDANVENPPSVTFENTTEAIKFSETSTETSYGILSTLKSFFLKWSKTNKEGEKSNDKTKFVDETKLTLGIDNKNYYRRIEYWRVYSRSTKNAIFIVKWLNSIYTKEEIAIDLAGDLKSKYSEAELNRILVYLKKEFENRLLTSESDYFEIRLELNQSDASPLRIPSIFGKSVGGNQSIIEYFTSLGRLHRFYEKKLFFRYRGTSTVEVNYFLELYKGMNVYSVCGIAFLQNLKNNESLPLFITTQNAPIERIFIETAQFELYYFLESFHAEIHRNYSKQDRKKFIVFPYTEENSALIEKYKNYDFAIVKNSSEQTEYILYHTPNTTTSEIGWASWRTVDIDFYQAVYKMLNIEIQGKTLTIQNYLTTTKVEIDKKGQP